MIKAQRTSCTYRHGARLCCCFSRWVLHHSSILVELTIVLGGLQEDAKIDVKANYTKNINLKKKKRFS